MTNNELRYISIMDMYDKIQTENKHISNDRKAEIYDKIPRIAEIDRIMADTAIENARKKLTGNLESSDSFKKNNNELIEEKERLLKENGYDADYLKPIYTCPICRDTGLINNSYCSCYKQATISFLYQQSTLNRILETENFDNFNLDYYPDENNTDKPFSPRENMSNILNISKEFVKTFDENSDCILLYGNTGLGKTFLSNCIAKELLDTGHTVLYQSSIHLFEDVCADVIMKKEENPRSHNTYRYIYDCDLLIIDDLGTEFTNSFVSSTLYDILNTRMRDNKSTIISTNLNPQELTERYSDRISTRIFAKYRVFYFYGDNIRIAKRRQAMEN